MASILLKEYPCKIDFFKGGIYKQTNAYVKSPLKQQTYFWSPRYGDNQCVFTVISDCNFGESKFLTVTQQFELQNINSEKDTYAVLEQCVYINYDSTLSVLGSKFDWFKPSFEFSPLDERALKRDLGVMLNNLPPELSAEKSFSLNTKVSVLPRAFRFAAFRQVVYTLFSAIFSQDRAPQQTTV